MSTKQAIFELNGEEYGLDITVVHTIEKDMDIKKMADSPNNVKGKINLRGSDIPVYSLRKKFGFEDKKPDVNTRFLITNVSGMDIAFEVDNVKGILDIESQNVFDAPKIIKRNNTSYIKSVAKVDNGLILLLDNEFLLDNGEIKALQSKNKK